MTEDLFDSCILLQLHESISYLSTFNVMADGWTSKEASTWSELNFSSDEDFSEGIIVLLVQIVIINVIMFIEST
jgi:hypothetical protein